MKRERTHYEDEGEFKATVAERKANDLAEAKKLIGRLVEMTHGEVTDPVGLGATDLECSHSSFPGAGGKDTQTAVGNN